MIFLHDHFFTLSYTLFPKATKSQQLVLLFFLAVSLAHKLAHLVRQHVLAHSSHMSDGNSILDWEPFFFGIPDPHDELGIAKEHLMFGGRIQPLNQSLSALVPDGLVILPLDMPRRPFYRDPPCRIGGRKAAQRPNWRDRPGILAWRRSGPRSIESRKSTNHWPMHLNLVEMLEL